MFSLETIKLRLGDYKIEKLRLNEFMISVIMFACIVMKEKSWSGLPEN